jgi:hypothetical protein
MPYIKYLTEDSKAINSQLDAMLEQGLKPCLFAPTGTGKTTLVYERMQKEASRGYLVMLAMPFTAITDNKGAQASKYGIESGVSSELDLTSYSHSGKAVQTTYEGAIGILKNTRRKDVKLYIDEAHILIAQSKLRNSCSELLDLNYDTIGMTATTHHLEDIGFTIYKPQRAIETPKIPVKVSISKASTSSILHKLICGYNRDSVLQIRVNDKEEIGKACNVANSKGIRYVAIYTADTDGILAINEHSGLTEAEVKNAQKGVFSENVDLILNTSKMDCGLDFKIEGSRPFKMVAVGNRKGVSNMMPNLADLAQAVNRMRWDNPLDADITIIGQFGAEVYKDSSNVFNAIKEATGTISALEHLHKYYWSKTQEYTEDEYRRVLAKYNVNLLASAEVVIQNSTVNPKRYASIFMRLNQFDGTEQTIEMAKAYGFNLEQYFIAHDNCSQSPSVMAKASLINSQLQSLFTHYKADTPIQSVWNGERYLNKNAEALISVARAKQSKSDMGMFMTRAEAKGELSKSDLNDLVEIERKAVKKYVQIVYNVKPKKFSDDKYKTIKLNVDKGASRVVTTKGSEDMALTTPAPKSLTNEEINEYLASA